MVTSIVCLTPRRCIAMVKSIHLVRWNCTGKFCFLVQAGPVGINFCGQPNGFYAAPQAETGKSGVRSKLRGHMEFYAWFIMRFVSRLTIDYMVDSYLCRTMSNLWSQAYHPFSSIFIHFAQMHLWNCAVWCGAGACGMIVSPWCVQQVGTQPVSSTRWFSLQGVATIFDW